MRKISTIVVHHSGSTDTPNKIKKLHVNINKWNDVGYHFMISREGLIIKGRELDIGYNKNSLGICLLGNFDKEKPYDPQIKTLKELIKKLKTKFNIEDIKFHRDFHNVEKSCPGININKKDLK